MEVHAHSHTPRKKWTHYFWEFLMLFLAVFCGFLAEYQLEHKIEKDRERQYMKSMLTDLMADTAHLKEGFPRKEERIAAIDSLFDYFSIHRDKNIIPAYVHNLMRRSSWDRAYDRNNITITQTPYQLNLPSNFFVLSPSLIFFPPFSFPFRFSLQSFFLKFP
ncbi:MAG: hypothetical protein IPO53_08480 [Chitinophagaceae bacterium]|nr:hypothetical protein [Chitinophagaceae bacterium]